jgi:type II secretory pathway component PulM
MRELTLREQILIGLMALFGVVLAVLFVQKQLDARETRLLQQLESKREQLAELERLGREWSDLQALPTAPTMQEPLSAFVEGIARQLEIQEGLQLNTLSSPPEGMEGVQVRLDKLNLEQALDVLYQLENHHPVLRLEQLLFSVSPGNRQIRLNFQVFKQRPAVTNS